MGVQNSRGYYWTQGDLCRAKPSVLLTRIISYLVHLLRRGDETSETAVGKWLK